MYVANKVKDTVTTTATFDIIVGNAKIKVDNNCGWMTVFFY